MESQQNPQENQELQQEIELFTVTVEELIDVEENIDFFTIHLAEYRDPGGVICITLLIANWRRDHLLDLLAYLTPQVTRIINQTDAMNVSTLQP